MIQQGLFEWPSDTWSRQCVTLDIVGVKFNESR
jgi:hypothetical protein